MGNGSQWRHQTVTMDVDEIDSGTHHHTTCNLSAPASCAPVLGYYGGDVWQYPAAGNGTYYFMLTQRLWHWQTTAQNWAEHGMRGPAKIDVGLAFSTDGINFEHLGGREPFLGPGPDGGWESRFVWAAPQPVMMDNEIWFYYAGTNRDHAGVLDPSAPTPPREGCVPERAGLWGSTGPLRCSLTGMGVARLRLDGFVSLTAPLHASPTAKQLAMATTPPLIFSGSTLKLNMNTGAGGSVSVSITNCSGQTLAESFPMVANGLAFEVQWRQNSVKVGALAGKPVCLELALIGAHVYAFQFM
eukprot:COSAG01_NODE_10137_length_2240_cov_15.120972_2_plen_300_part_00